MRETGSGPLDGPKRPHGSRRLSVRLHAFPDRAQRAGGRRPRPLPQRAAWRFARVHAALTVSAAPPSTPQAKQRGSARRGRAAMVLSLPLTSDEQVGGGWGGAARGSCSSGAPTHPSLQQQ